MNNLVLITDSFPLGGVTESAFIQKEIPLLSNAFQKITILPENNYGLCNGIEGSDNIAVDTYFVDNYKVRTTGQLLKLLSTKYAQRALLSDIGLVNNRLKLISMLNYVSKAMFWVSYLEPKIKKGEIAPQTTVFYTFWFMEASLALAMLAEKYPIKFFCRAHGYDMFDDRVNYRSHYLRNFTFSKMQHVWACSQCGSDYMRAQYPKWQSKIDVSYLGCTKTWEGMNPPKRNCNDIVFLTCARMHPVKRLPMTFNLLSRLAEKLPEKEIKWIVVGDGDDRTVIEQTILRFLPTNMKVDLRGALPNQQFQKILTEEHVDWGIMLSESEGFGLTICEMMAYGIPGIVTNVGGLPEVIGHDSGICLSENPTGDELYYAIMNYLDDEVRYNSFRRCAYIRWSNYFDSTNLRKAFVDGLSN